jgi:hypothetical protein
MSLVIVLDNSPSMGRMRDGKTLLDLAKAETAKVLDQLGPADRVELLLTAGDAEPYTTTDRAETARELSRRAGEPTAMMAAGEQGAAASVPALTNDSAKLRAALAKVPAGTAVSLAGYGDGAWRDFGYDMGRVRALLERTKVSALPGDVRGALKTAAGVLAASRDGDRKVLLFTDAQASDWHADAASDVANLDVRVVTIEPGGAAAPNLGIDACDLSQTSAGLGERVTATFTIRNYAAEPSPAATLTVVAGDRDRPAEAKVPPIPPASSMLVTVPVRASGRDHLLCTATIRSPTDAFAYDNSWHFQLGVRPPVTTLCVNGQSGAAGADKSTFFVMNALATRAGGGAAGADARECELENLKDQKLFQYAVVLLADVKSLDPDTRQRLRQFVADGGGLLMFASPDATPDEYNNWGILPATVTAQRPKNFLYVKSLAARSAAVADVRDRAASAVQALSTDASAALEPADGASVLATFSDGSPALVEGRSGKGRGICAAASCHVSQSDWPLRPAFVLMVRQLVQYLGTGGDAGAVLSDRTVGDGAARTIPAERAGGTPAAFRLIANGPAAAYEPLPWYRSGGRLMLPRASAPGQYLLAVRPESIGGLLTEPGLGATVTPISVNHSPAESDLRPASGDAIGNQMPGATVSVSAIGADVTASLRDGRELWRLLLLAVLAFLVLESLIAWRWASDSSK